MMEELEKIEAFIRKHHVMTLATVGGEGRPWVAHAFYAWMAAERCFVFMNNPATRHGAEMSACPHVAAAIALETRIVGRLQGLQIEGEVRLAGSGEPPAEGGGDNPGKGGELAAKGGEPPVKGGELAAARRAYLRRFPYATVMEQPLWILEPRLMKLTDNTLGFGKKLIWNNGDLII